MSRHWSEALTRLDACGAAIEWARTQPSLAIAWGKCQRSDWMCWLLRAAGKPTRLIAADIAESVWHLVAEERQLACAWAIDAARRGDLEEMAAAADAAYDAYAYAAATAAADAYAYAAYAAATAAYAYYDAYDAGAAKRAEIADIVRRYCPKPPVIMTTKSTRNKRDSYKKEG